EPELVRLAKYIEEKERQLSNYSDKLRDSVEAIFYYFSRQSRCPVSIDITDTIPFYHNEKYDLDYYLAFRRHDLVIVIRPSGQEEWENIEGPGNISREALKALVKSGRLVEFLKIVSQKLEELNKEYGEVSEAAEKMAKAIGVMKSE
ncbi:MAG: hypothetical protein MRT15_10220, partial [archaeon YNP-LCB-003-016]|uniref:hypothetical protein n=1 Tax=Candidatus Culexarchaeum yellowstonense TaxID=2928963 RepID=UPI0026F30133